MFQHNPYALKAYLQQFILNINFSEISEKEIIIFLKNQRLKLSKIKG